MGVFPGQSYFGETLDTNTLLDRYFVGSGTNWSSTASWALTSGGAPGASVPDATMNVYLDANSPGNLTIDVPASCLTFDCTGFTHTCTVAAVALTVAGLLFRLAATMTYTANAGGATRFTRQAAGTVMITTAGKSPAGPSFGYTSPSSATFQLQDDFNCAGSTFIHGAGTLDLNGHNLACSAFQSNSTNTRTFIAAASGITCTTWTVTTAGLTVTSMPATITATGSTFAGAGLTYNTVTLTGATPTITGANTFGTLTWTATNSQGCTLTVSADQTITGTLTLTGFGLAARPLVSSDAVGTTRTLTAAAVTMTYVDFMDITMAGAGAPYGGTSIGDCLGNSGITFTPAVTRYAKAAGSWSSTATWAATSGGVAGASTPLPQDTVYMDATAAAGTYGGQPRLCKDLICTGFTRTLSVPNQIIYGSLTLAAGMTMTSGTLTVAGRGSHTITMAGRTLGSGSLYMANPGGTYTLQDTFTAASITPSAAGTLNDGGQQVNLTSVGLNAGPAGSALIMTGVWTLSGTGTIWSPGSTALTATGSTINITDASSTSKTFTGGGKTYGNLTITGGGSGTVSIGGANTFAVLTIGAPKTVVLPTVTQTVSNLVARGSAGNVIDMHCTTANGTKATLATPATVGGISLAWCTLTDVAATVATWWVDSNTTQLRCTGFTAGPPARTKTLTQTQAAPKLLRGRILTATQSQAVSYTRGLPPLTLVLTQAQSLNAGRVPARALTATQAQAASYTTTQTSAGKARTLTATQSQSPSTTAAPARRLACAQGQAASCTHPLSRVLSATQSQSSRLAAALTRALIVGQAQAAALVRQRATALSAAQSQVSLLGPLAGRSLAASQSQAVSFNAVVLVHRFRTLALTQSALVSSTRAALRTIALTQAQAQRVAGAATGAFSATQPQAGSVRLLVSLRQISVAQQQVIKTTMGHGARYAYQGQVSDLTSSATRTFGTAQNQALVLTRRRSSKRAKLTATATPTVTLTGAARGRVLVESDASERVRILAEQR